MTARLTEAIAAIGPLDEAAMEATRAHLDRLTKPPGSLGRLEELAIQLAGITGDPHFAVEPRTIVVAAADHGVARSRSVSAWPSEVTAQMVANFLRGGAAISALGRLARANLVIVDVGVASPIPAVDPVVPDVTFVGRPIRMGTADLWSGPAMARSEAEAAVAVGLDVAADAIAAGARVVGTGEMGIGNSTAAAALVAVLTGRPAHAVTGRGTGVDEAGLARKVAAVAQAVERVGDEDEPLVVLAAVGGLEIAALVGVILGAAAARVPVILDGFITGAAALVAAALQPSIRGRLVAAHRSTEPGHAITLERLGLRPLLELDLRLGEGTGAATAMPLLDAAVRIRDGMATFDAAGVAARNA